MTSRQHRGSEEFAPLVVTVVVAVTEQFSNGSILAFYYLQLVEVDEIYSMEQCGFRFRDQKIQIVLNVGSVIEFW